MSRRPNIEALRLYRDILRRSRSFYWPNDKGEPWNKVLQESARKEFEQARHETDPLIVARLLVVGRDALMQLEDKVSFLFTGHVVLPALAELLDGFLQHLTDSAKTSTDVGARVTARGRLPSALMSMTLARRACARAKRSGSSFCPSAA